jgi:hypothetical protein
MPLALAEDDIAAISELFDAEPQVAERFALFLHEMDIDALALMLVRNAG